ncbi:hypothetical protein KGQ19_08745 [Catenulispora sp. NL8]|uniref:Uncharacterized protein n=1 Tax=Catenulispora pinistramenti TaxID=2705254 RepID=A0ABS5KLR7_9ACTN|nr:hypothetical protein [Catenulispora pinistramenti]MBS2546955.1 hypothetical protein [Catenulispora pinistramenti]
MTHFAIPDDEFLSLEDEDEFVPILDDGDMTLSDGFAPLGLSLVPKELTFTIVIFAFAAGVDTARWWSR